MNRLEKVRRAWYSGAMMAASGGISKTTRTCDFSRVSPWTHLRAAYTINQHTSQPPQHLVDPDAPAIAHHIN
jgi:hypothetical protein